MKFMSFARASALLYVAFFGALSASAQVDVLTHHNDTSRTGANLSETALTPTNVNLQHFGLLFKHAVDDQLYTQPLVVSALKVNGGFHDIVYVTTVNNSVYAFDANDGPGTGSGPALWHVNFGTPASLHDADFGCLDINGNMGIIGTPVIDRARNALYVVALTKAGGSFQQRLHALDLATGADLPQSPVTIEAPEFDPLMQNQRTALALANGTLYIGYASHCDKEPYHGFLLGYDEATLKRIGILNTSPGGTGASIWQSGLAPAIDAEGNVFIVTGNGSWDGKTQLSESFLKLDKNMQLTDWFTPTNHLQLDEDDNDLNSSGAVLIPGTHLVLGGGKEGVLYLLDTSKLGHLGDENAVQHFKATGSHLHSLVYWESAKQGKLLYLWGQRDKLRAYQFTGNKLSETPVMSRPEMNEGHPGAMVSLSANGNKEGILWTAIHATGDSWHESRPGILHAYAADDITHELWNSLQNPARDNCNNYSKMAPPTIANGKVFLASFGKENTGTGQLCVYGLLPSGRALAAPKEVRAAVSTQAASTQPTGQSISIEWPEVPGATSYTVECARAGKTHIAASGLVRPTFSEPASELGPVEYTVRAINSNGPSPRSQPAKITVEKTPMPRTMVMH